MYNPVLVVRVISRRQSSRSHRSDLYAFGTLLPTCPLEIWPWMFPMPGNSDYAPIVSSCLKRVSEHQPSLQTSNPWLWMSAFLSGFRCPLLFLYQQLNPASPSFSHTFLSSFCTLRLPTVAHGHLCPSWAEWPRSNRNKMRGGGHEKGDTGKNASEVSFPVDVWHSWSLSTPLVFPPQWRGLIWLRNGETYTGHFQFSSSFLSLGYLPAYSEDVTLLCSPGVKIPFLP